MVLGICRYHRNSNGWNDIGYNFLVDRYGTIFEGRAGGIAEAVVGAQAQGYNSQSTGIASLGTFSTAGQTDAGLRAIAHLLGWKLGVHGVPARGRVAVVSGGGSTNRYPAGSRPSLRAHLGPPRRQRAPRARATACTASWSSCAAMVAPGPPRATTATAASAARRNIPYGQKAVIRARPRRAPGTPLAGKTVDVQLLGRLGWRTQHSVSTDAAGNGPDARADGLQPDAEGALRRETPGLLPSSSPPVAIGVRPQVTVSIGDARRGARRRGPGHRGRRASQDARRAVREAPDPLGRVGARVASHGGAAIGAAAHDAADATAGPLPGAAVGASRRRNLAARSAAALPGPLNIEAASPRPKVTCFAPSALARSELAPLAAGASRRSRPRYRPFPLSSMRAVSHAGCGRRGAATSARCTRGRARSARATGSAARPLHLRPAGDARLDRQAAELARRRTGRPGICTVGRGPTRLRSPRSTLTRFGSSSSEKRRSSAPMRVMRGIALVSCSSARAGPPTRSSPRAARCAASWSGPPRRRSCRAGS